MPIEKFQGGTMITGDAIPLFQLMTLKSGLSIECKTGMQMTRGKSCYKIIKERFGLKGNKHKVLEQFTALVATKQAEFAADPKNGVAQ